MSLYRFNPLPKDGDLVGPRLTLTTHVIELLDVCLPKCMHGEGHENVAYIGGWSQGENRHGNTVIMPHVVTAPRRYDTDVASHALVGRALCDLDVEVVAQIHTHPGPGVYHSDGDDELAFIKGEGFWSIVVPNYAAAGCLPLTNCGFHLYRNGAFHLLSDAAVEARVSIQPTFVDLR